MFAKYQPDIILSNQNKQMKKYSTKSASNIYLRNQTNLLSEKYSPEYRKRKIKNIKVTIQNPDLYLLLTKAKNNQHPYLSPNDKALTIFNVNPQNLLYSQQGKESASQNKRSTLSNKFSSRLHQFQQFSVSQIRKKEVEMMRKIRTRQQKEYAKRKLQQIQFQYLQRKREKEINLQRKKSEFSFTLETNRETIELVKNSRHQKARSEVKLTKQIYWETQRNHEFQSLKSKVGKMQQSQILAYHKNFLINQSKNEINNNSASKMHLSLKMSTCIQQKLNVLPRIKQKSKIKRNGRVTKKASEQRLNVQKEVIILPSNSVEAKTASIQKVQDKAEVQMSKNKLEKEEHAILLVKNQNQVGQKKL